MPPSAAREPEDVEREIAHARFELDSTLEELGRRLDPEHIRSEAKTYLHQKASALRHGATRLAEEHPAVVLGALVGVVALVSLSRRRGARALADEREAQMRSLLAIVSRSP